MVSTKDWRASRKPPLAARDDEAVEIGELGWGADELGGYAEGDERFGVGFECALQSEDADGERTVLPGCGLLVHCGVVICSPDGLYHDLMTLISEPLL